MNKEEIQADYVLVKEILDKKRKALRFHRSYGEVLLLRAMKQKYGLINKTSATKLLYHLRKCEQN